MCLEAPLRRAEGKTNDQSECSSSPNNPTSTTIPAAPNYLSNNYLKLQAIESMGEAFEVVDRDSAALEA